MNGYNADKGRTVPIFEESRTLYHGGYTVDVNETQVNLLKVSFTIRYSLRRKTFEPNFSSRIYFQMVVNAVLDVIFTVSSSGY